MREEPGEVWVTGQLALALLAVDPHGLGGLHLRARAGPVRQAFLDHVPDRLGPLSRIAPGIDDAQLFGGTDIAASLAAGRKVEGAGILARGRPVLLTMAERCLPELAAKLGQGLDAGTLPSLVLLDEGVDAERAPVSLTERLAFSFDLDGIRLDALADIALDPGEIAAARERLGSVALPDAALAALTAAAVELGILSLRAPLFAAMAARAHAALSGREAVGDGDLSIAATLVLAPRATRLPEPPDDDDVQEPEAEESDDSDPGSGDTIPADMLIEAVRAMLPPGVLERRAAQRAAAQTGSGQGARRRGNRRGRPLPARPGKPSSSTRIDLVATLRAAAPWQTLRREQAPERSGIIVRSSDLRVRRYEEQSDRLVIFCVDASGSAAMARLGEAKGAVELMLAEAYAKRDRVALIAFRGEGAELLLPPTRSLVQAKRRLAGQPGGGGTPLASGLQAAHALVLQGARSGFTPALALLTDGRANVPLPGGAGRAQAMADADQMARLIGAQRIGGAVIDTGTRPRGELSALASHMGLAYLALPRANAAQMKSGLDAALET
ncbi:magnesium chelatase [Roseivivax halodurans JCM 10272]|uniref:Magnesium chelatase n=1 Tax=Roseivivax halodurans JCM 10272 TaxID=1449350 RepID=X7EJ48_9RHOB|nr:magnesium chelatase subunit D [Roseivivax halodurans]ETX15917.1 magnesium chelatase [Roseivivax halodurans JCM 10272]